MGEHGQGGPAVPGPPAPPLVLIQSDQSFGGLERFFDAPALTGDGDQGAQRNGSGGVAAQVGMLAGGVVAADQQMMAAGVGVVFGQQPKPRPGVTPWPVRAGTGGVALPGMCRDQRGQRIDADRAGMGGHAPVGRNRHHVTQSVASNGCAQSWVGPVDFVAGHPPRGYSGGHSAVDQCCRQRWFGRETPLVGRDPASAQRSWSSAQLRGRYRARSISACPRGAAYVRYTATWEFSTRPAVPLYWRCTPTLCTPFLTSPVSSTTKIAPGSPNASTT